MLSVAKEIAGRDNCIARDFALHDYVALMNERILKTLPEIIDGRSSRGRRCQDIWKERGRRIAVGIVGIFSAAAECGAAIGWNRADGLTGRQSCVNQRVDDDRAVDPAVVNSITTTQAGPAVTTQVCRETDAWSKVILVARPVGGLR